MALLLLVPGVVGIARLHPYEYVYYNELVGGLQGAEGRFELDYWATGFREAMETINDVAPAKATVAVAGSRQAAAPSLATISMCGPKATWAGRDAGPIS